MRIFLFCQARMYETNIKTRRKKKEKKKRRRRRKKLDTKHPSIRYDSYFIKETIHFTNN